MQISSMTAGIHDRIENTLTEREYFAQFAGDHETDAISEPEPESVSVFAGLPTTTVDAIVRRLLSAMEAEGYIRKQVRTMPPVPPLQPRTVPTPAPRPVGESPKTIVEALAGERLYLRSLWYDPTISMRERWEAIVDDGEGGQYSNIKVWVWPEDKEKIVKAGYSARLFDKTITRRLLDEAIPVSIKWTDSGAKRVEVLPRIEVNRRAS